MTGLRASGAIVSTYWSVLVTVRMAHTEITEIGIRIDASTTSTQAEIAARQVPAPRLASCPRARSRSPSRPTSPASRRTRGAGAVRLHWGSVSLIWASHLPMPSANGTGAHAFPRCTDCSRCQLAKSAGRIEPCVRVVDPQRISAFVAPLVFFSVIVLRKVNRRGKVHSAS